MPSRVKVCRECGVVTSEGGARCPSCGARAGRDRGRARALVVAAVLTVMAWAGLRFWPGRSDPALAANVRASSIGYRLSANQSQTDVTGSVDNDNAVPVDVTVRVRGIDWGDNVVADFEVGPIRNVEPGASRPIRATLDLTPVRSATIDVVRVVRSKP
jgi:hypothetical protein